MSITDELAETLELPATVVETIQLIAIAKPDQLRYAYQDLATAWLRHYGALGAWIDGESTIEIRTEAGAKHQVVPVDEGRIVMDQPIQRHHDVMIDPLAGPGGGRYILADHRSPRDLATIIARYIGILPNEPADNEVRSADA